MKDTQQICATVKTETVEKVDELAESDKDRSRSSMVYILLEEAVKAREDRGFIFKNTTNLTKIE